MNNIDSRSYTNQTNSHQLSVPILAIVICSFVGLFLLIAAIVGNANNTSNRTKADGYASYYGANPENNINEISAEDNSDIVPTEEYSAEPDYVYLTSLSPYTHSAGGFPFFDVYSGDKDIFGNVYTTGFQGHLSSCDGEAYVIYRLNGEYSQFVFTLAIDSADCGNQGEGSMFVYADDELVFERNRITSDTETETITINISGVKDLRIEIYGQTTPEVSITGFSSVWPMMADPILYR